MDRITYLKNLESQRGIDAFSPLFSAFLACISPNEVCQLLDLGFDQDFFVREKIVKRILEDMSVAFLECHHELMNTLLALLSTLPRKKTASCAYCVDHLFPQCSIEIKDRIIESLISSRYKDLRNRAYKLLRQVWDERWIPVVSLAWNTHKESTCAVLIVERMPPLFLQNNFHDLFSQLPSFGLMGRFYGRLPHVQAEHLTRLREEDGITYAYVLVKLGLHLTEVEALEIYKENRSEERVGLLIWAIGKMKLWDVLAEIEAGRRFEHYPKAA